MDKAFDLVIIGAGPSSIFTALQLVRNKTKLSIAIFEQGKSLKNRVCPKSKSLECASCKPFCHITTGFSGAGAFSDGKLSLSHEVGGDLPQLIGVEKTVEMIEFTDKIYLEFGADTKIEGISDNDKIKEIRKKAISAGLKLVDCPIRHLGTEKAHEIYSKIESYLEENGINLFFNCSCTDFIIEDGKILGVKIYDYKKDETFTVSGERVVVGTGRKGADWLQEMCEKHRITHSAGTVDIGVRVEVRSEIMEEINEVLYESKLIGHVEPFHDKVRTFCQNPGGFVSQENYDNNLAVVNGHAFKERKSPNTNIAILSSHNFSVPFDRPIDYAKKVGELTNMLGNGHIMVQRFGDILDGKRTWQKELADSNVRPTLKDAVAGDITAAMPYRPMTNIINFIKAVDRVVPGFASKETLLYSPEMKFYSNKIDLDEHFMTNIQNLYALGDSSGWTRGLMMASVMGVITGNYFSK